MMFYVYSYNSSCVSGLATTASVPVGDLQRVKRPPTAFAGFLKEYTKTADPTLTKQRGGMMRSAGDQWKRMSDADKQVGFAN